MTRRSLDDRVRWAAEAVTFYAPEHWGLMTGADLLAFAENEPAAFWDRLLDQVVETGVDYLELCFEPGDWTGLRRAYGDAASVRRVLDRRGLTLSGSYQGGGHRLEQAVDDETVATALADEMREHAAFVREVGGATVMMGPPRRFQLRGAYDAALDADLLGRLARVLDLLGASARAEGVGFAIHTEAYTFASRESDVARVLDATDPELVSLCVDAGHVTLDGGDPVAMIVAGGARVTNIHAKDCAGVRTSLPTDGEVSHEQMMEQFRLLGDGVVDWRGVFGALRDAGFRGFAAAEIDLIPDPVGATTTVLERYDRELAEIVR
jgi:inosose dehydratase